MTLSAISILKSKTRSAIFQLFFNNPNQEYYLRQIEGLTGYSAGNIRREIIKLEEDGIFLSRNIGKTKLYMLNKAYPLYDEIRNIINKTIGIEGGLRGVLGSYKKIKFAFIYGSYAEAREHALSDIDLIIIGEIKPKEVKSAIFQYQSKIGREINSIIYTEKEFLSKAHDKNHFISTVLNTKKVFVRGDSDEFRRFI